MSNKIRLNQGAYNSFQDVPSTVVHKFGRNPDVGTTFEVVTTLGGSYVYLSTAVTMDVVSDEAADTIAGANARKFKVVGLDANFNPLEEEVELNGLTPVTTTGEFIRVFRAFVTEVGTYNSSNLGDITVSATGGADQVLVETGKGQTQTARYTIPAGKIGLVKFTYVSINSNKEVDVRLFRRENADNTSTNIQANRLNFEANGLTQDTVFKPYIPSEFMPKTDIWIEAKVSTGSAIVTADMEIVLRDITDADY